MAKKQKTLRDLDLREIVSKITDHATYIHMLAEDKETLQRTLTHAEFTEKLFNNITEFKETARELSKRFNAPVHYEEYDDAHRAA